MEQVTGTTAYKDFVSANASKSDFCEAEFFDYLQNTAKLSTNTCASYVSSIRSAEHYAVDHGHVSCSLFSKDKETIIATATELYSEPDFIKYNEHQHNRFSAAINKLLESIGAKIPEKAIAPHGDNCNRQSIASAEVNSKIIAVLKKHYEYGFKYDSIRELMRFRQFADDMGVALPEKDEELKASIRSSGIVIAGKVYCNSDDMSKELQRIVDNVFFSGAGVIYYESLFENEQEWMESHVITSPDMLKEYLQTSITGYSYSKKFMAKGDIISQELWDSVQKRRSRVNRASAWGTHSNRLSGYLYCADCGRRMTLQTHYSKKDGSVQYSYRCGGYASRVNSCTSHSISTDNVEALILSSVKRFSRFVLNDEQAFALELQSLWNEKQEEKPKHNQSELQRCQKRYDELSTLVRGLYENLMSGLLPERQYKQLMKQYDDEQAELETKMETMKTELAEEKVSSVDIKHFISLIRKCKNPTEISDTMFNELVDKIVVYEAEGVGKARTQKVDIYFNYVGWTIVNKVDKRD